MVQATLLRSLILSSFLCMALCSSDVPAPLPKDANVPNAAALAPSKDSKANITATPTVDTPAGLNSTDSEPASSGDGIPIKKDGAEKTNPLMAGSSMVPGVMSLDGKCTCPGVAPAGSPASDRPSPADPSPPPVMPDNNTTVSTNETSASSLLRAPTKLFFILVAAVAGINAFTA